MPRATCSFRLGMSKRHEAEVWATLGIDIETDIADMQATLAQIRQEYYPLLDNGLSNGLPWNRLFIGRYLWELRGRLAQTRNNLPAIVQNHVTDPVELGLYLWDVCRFYRSTDPEWRDIPPAYREHLGLNYGPGQAPVPPPPPPIKLPQLAVQPDRPRTPIQGPLPPALPLAQVSYVTLPSIAPLLAIAPAPPVIPPHLPAPILRPRRGTSRNPVPLPSPTHCLAPPSVPGAGTSTLPHIAPLLAIAPLPDRVRDRAPVPAEEPAADTTGGSSKSPVSLDFVAEKTPERAENPRKVVTAKRRREILEELENRGMIPKGSSIPKSGVVSTNPAHKRARDDDENTEDDGQSTQPARKKRQTSENASSVVPQTTDQTEQVEQTEFTTLSNTGLEQGDDPEEQALQDDPINDGQGASPVLPQTTGETEHIEWAVFTTLSDTNSEQADDREEQALQDDQINDGQGASPVLPQTTGETEHIEWAVFTTLSDTNSEQADDREEQALQDDQINDGQGASPVLPQTTGETERVEWAAFTNLSDTDSEQGENREEQTLQEDPANDGQGDIPMPDVEYENYRIPDNQAEPSVDPWTKRMRNYLTSIGPFRGIYEEFATDAEVPEGLEEEEL